MQNEANHAAIPTHQKPHIARFTETKKRFKASLETLNSLLIGIEGGTRIRTGGEGFAALYQHQCKPCLSRAMIHHL
jgi:hypothetical protein